LKLSWRQAFGISCAKLSNTNDNNMVDVTANAHHLAAKNGNYDQR
jgi:hypothetical protein